METGHRLHLDDERQAIVGAPADMQNEATQPVPRRVASEPGHSAPAARNTACSRAWWRRQGDNETGVEVRPIWLQRPVTWCQSTGPLPQKRHPGPIMAPARLVMEDLQVTRPAFLKDGQHRVGVCQEGVPGDRPPPPHPLLEG